MVPSDGLALVEAYTEQAHVLRARVLEISGELWDSMPSTRKEHVDWFVSQVVPLVEAGQAQTASLTFAYVDEYAKVMGLNVSQRRSLDRAVNDLRGVSLDVVYRRPASTVYAALADGVPYDRARVEGARRLSSLVSTDLQLAKTHASKAGMGAYGMKWYRRVTIGEETCALCMIASTRAYKTSDLMPIHPGCDCGVEPLPERAALEIEQGTYTFDRDTLESVHSAVEGAGVGVDRGGRVTDYRKLVVTREHGEYGPTIGWRDQKFTGVSQLAR